MNAEIKTGNVAEIHIAFNTCNIAKAIHEPLSPISSKNLNSKIIKINSINKTIIRFPPYKKVFLYLNLISVKNSN